MAKHRDPQAFDFEGVCLSSVATRIVTLHLPLSIPVGTVDQCRRSDGPSLSYPGNEVWSRIAGPCPAPLERRVWSCRESCPRCRILCRLFPELYACMKRLECRVKVESNQMERSTRTPPAICQSAVPRETWRSYGGYENPRTSQTGCCLATCRYMESRLSRSCAGCPRGLAMVRAILCVLGS